MRNFTLKGKEGMLANLLGGATVVRAVLVDTNLYTFSPALQYLGEIPLGARVDISNPLTGLAFTDGKITSDSGLFPAATGAESEAIALFVDSGDPNTSLIWYWDDEDDELPYLPNGGDLVLNWAASVNGIATL